MFFFKQQRHRKPLILGAWGLLFWEPYGSRLLIEGPHSDITFGPNSSGEISPNAAVTRAHKLPKEERQHQFSLACRLYFNSQRIWHQQTAEKRLTRHCIVSHLERLLAVARYIDFSDLFSLWMQRNLLHKCNIDKGRGFPLVLPNLRTLSKVCA